MLALIREASLASLRSVWASMPKWQWTKMIKVSMVEAMPVNRHSESANMLRWQWTNLTSVLTWEVKHQSLHKELVSTLRWRWNKTPVRSATGTGRCHLNLGNTPKWLWRPSMTSLKTILITSVRNTVTGLCLESARDNIMISVKVRPAPSSKFSDL